MNPLEGVALGWQCVRRTLREAAYAPAWLPWLLLFAAEAAVALALAWGAHPALSWLVAPVLRLLHRGDLLRYPALYRALPALAARADDALAVALVPLAAGASTRLLAERFDGRRSGAGAALAEALRRGGALIGAAAPATLAAMLLHLGSDLLIAQRVSSFTRRFAPDVAVALGGVAFAACLFAAALVVLERRGLVAALAALPGTWARGFAAALTIVVLGTLPQVPLLLLARGADVIVDRGVPELTLALTLARDAVAAGCGWLAAGAATLAFQSALARRPEAGT